MPLRYHLAFAKIGQRFQLSDERIENEHSHEGYADPYFYFRYEHNQPVINLKDGATRRLEREEIDSEQSILSQRKDPDQYPELTYLGEEFGRIRIYREWSFGRYTCAPSAPMRQLSGIE